MPAVPSAGAPMSGLGGLSVPTGPGAVPAVPSPAGVGPSPGAFNSGSGSGFKLPFTGERKPFVARSQALGLAIGYVELQLRYS